MPPEGERPAVYEFGEFRLDGAVLEFEGRLVPLTPKAVDTLGLLVARAPEVVSKEEILATVWPGTFVVESGLARNVSVIRKALEEFGGAADYIETIPKRGYRFVAPVKRIEGLPAEKKSKPAAPRRWGWAAAVLAVLCSAAFWMIRRPAAHPPAQRAELIGWYLLEKATPEEALRALQQFEEAAVARPDSGAAHAGIPETLLAAANLAAPQPDFGNRARRAAEMAVRLSPRMAAAHTALAAVRMYADWDFQSAERSFLRALQLDSESKITRFRYAQFLSWRGRPEEALRVAEAAERADPVSPLIGVQLGVVLHNQRRFESAARQFLRVLERERSYALAHYYLALSDGYLGRYGEAAAHLAKVDLNPGVLRTDAAWLELRKGNRGPAEQRYREIRQEVSVGDASPWATLVLAAGLGYLDEAFRDLEAGIARRAADLLGIASDPRLDALRADARWAAAARKIEGR